MMITTAEVRRGYNFNKRRVWFVFSRSSIVISFSHFLIWFYSFGRGLPIRESLEVIWWRNVSVVMAGPRFEAKIRLPISTVSIDPLLLNCMCSGLILGSLCVVLYVMVSWIWYLIVKSENWPDLLVLHDAVSRCSLRLFCNMSWIRSLVLKRWKRWRRSN